MGKLGNDIAKAIAAMGGNSQAARINMRAQEVRQWYKEALEKVYGQTAELFLAHTNNVYIMDKDGVRTLIVYVDESIFAADLNAQRELIKLKLLELFGEPIEEFEIYVSRASYKKNHPYLTEDKQESDEPIPSIPLDSDEKAQVSNTVSVVDDKKLREAIQKAMTADLEWKKGEKACNPAKNAN